MSLDKIRSKYNSNSAAIELPSEEVIWLPSRILPLNYQMGGGIPMGTILELFGYESSGKSLLAYDFAAVCQALGGVVLWNDAENAFDSAWSLANGVDPERVELLTDNAVEVFSDWMNDMIHYHRSVLTNNQPILLIQDSTAALDCLDNINSEQSTAKAEMGNRAKAIYKMLRIRRKMLSDMGVCTIFINQVRQKVGANMFQDSTTTPGGEALKFFASQRMAILKGSRLKGSKDVVYGHISHLHMKKNKMAPPRGKSQLEVHFEDSHQGYVGYNRYSGLANILELEGYIKKSKGSYIFNGEFDLGASKKNLDDIWSTNKQARLQAIKLLGINTISKTRKRIEGLGKNKYKVALKKSKKATE